MPIVGAVLTLAPGTDPSGLTADPRLTLGPTGSYRVPVVLETRTRSEDREAWEAIELLPGVIAVDVVFADFSDLVDEAAP